MTTWSCRAQYNKPDPFWRNTQRTYFLATKLPPRKRAGQLWKSLHGPSVQTLVQQPKMWAKLISLLLSFLISKMRPIIWLLRFLVGSKKVSWWRAQQSGLILVKKVS
jgi:hypothetical protein